MAPREKRAGPRLHEGGPLAGLCFEHVIQAIERLRVDSGKHNEEHRLRIVSAREPKPKQPFVSQVLSPAPRSDVVADRHALPYSLDVWEAKLLDQRLGVGDQRLHQWVSMFELHTGQVSR